MNNKNMNLIISILLIFSLTCETIYSIYFTLKFCDALSVTSVVLRVLGKFPIVLLILYFLKYKSQKLIASSIVLYLFLFSYDLIHSLIDNYTSDYKTSTFYIVIYIIKVIAFAILLINIFANNKILLISRIVTFVYVAINIMYFILTSISSIQYIEYFDVRNLLFILYDISEIIISFALAFHFCQCIGNPLFKQKEVLSTIPKTLNLEEQLLKLKNLYDNNKMSEEEYNKQKIEILNKL